ncbi:nucleotidyl transferase AbiEii/AbiGii toxin family protein [archaeon]|nr:nucleotidyl transferase AbiEii/AbiGii toxin family protein [archaeon]
MIPLAEIKRLAAGERIPLGTVERDYVICWFLYGVSKIATQDLIFKGGTALRKTYFPLWRFSEDLDFSSRKTMEEEEIESLLKSVNEKALKGGIVFDIKSLHVNPEYCMGKIYYTGPLQTKNSFKLDISMNEFLHERYLSREVLWEYSDKEKVGILVYSLEEILAEKLRSLLQRGKSRDYYDIWTLLGAHRKDINMKTTRQIFKKKCRHLSVPFNGVDDFFDADALAETERFWERGLAHQIDELPGFDTVIGECKSLVEIVFGRQ